MAVFTVCDNVLLIVEMLTGGIIGVIPNVAGILLEKKTMWESVSCAKNAEIQLHRAGSHIRSDHAVYRTDHHHVRRRRRAGTEMVHALRIFALCVVPYLWNKFYRKLL